MDTTNIVTIVCAIISCISVLGSSFYKIKTSHMKEKIENYEKELKASYKREESYLKDLEFFIILEKRLKKNGIYKKNTMRNEIGEELKYKPKISESKIISSRDSINNKLSKLK